MEHNNDLLEHIVELNVNFEKLITSIDVLKQKQDLVADDISKIKEAVYNPDEGLYARIRELETWKKGMSRVVWALSAGIASLILSFVKHHILT